MDFLQIVLIFLILLLSVFLTVTGIQVFFILRDLKKALDRLNKIIETDDKINQYLGKDITPGKNSIQKKEYKVKPKRFYKKVL